MEPVSTITHRSVPRKSVFVLWSIKIGQSTNWHSWKTWYSRFGRAVFSTLPMAILYNIQWHFWCHHFTIVFLDPENVDFNVLYAILLTFWITSLCVVVLMSDHLGKWRRVRTSNDVFTQFCDPHTPMIDFWHADKWYSATGTIFFFVTREALGALTYITCNASIHQGRVPMTWKAANTVPVAEVHPPRDIHTDLRPISLTPTLAKIF